MTYFDNFRKLNDHLFGKELFIRFTACAFRKLFMYLVISLLVLRAGCGIWLYRFLIIAYLFTLSTIQLDGAHTFHQKRDALQLIQLTESPFVPGGLFFLTHMTSISLSMADWDFFFLSRPACLSPRTLQLSQTVNHCYIWNLRNYFYNIWSGFATAELFKQK